MEDVINPDASKQAEEKKNHVKNCFNYSDIYFNNMPLEWKNTQKYIGLYLDAKLNFSDHTKEKKKKKKAVKGISLIKILNVT